MLYFNNSINLSTKEYSDINLWKDIDKLKDWQIKQLMQLFRWQKVSTIFFVYVLERFINLLKEHFLSLKLLV
jgi:hypothetical protein